MAIFKLTGTVRKVLAGWRVSVPCGSELAIPSDTASNTQARCSRHAGAPHAGNLSKDFHRIVAFSRALALFARSGKGGTVAVMLGRLWSDSRGEISEYALILSIILVLGMGMISRTGGVLHRLYGTVASQEAETGRTAPK